MQTWVIILTIIFIITKSIPKFPVFPFSVDDGGVYSKVAQEIKPGTPLLELPVKGENHYETIKITMRQLDGSTIHWGNLVVGYGGKSTSEYFELVDLDSRF